MVESIECLGQARDYGRKAEVSARRSSMRRKPVLPSMLLVKPKGPLLITYHRAFTFTSKRQRSSAFSHLSRYLLLLQKGFGDMIKLEKESTSRLQGGLRSAGGHHYSSCQDGIPVCFRR